MTGKRKYIITLLGLMIFSFISCVGIYKNVTVDYLSLGTAIGILVASFCSANVIGDHWLNLKKLKENK